ncbi:MAG: PhoPQ-activated pathogenicity-related family protein [Pirellulales bacterium]
MKRHARMIMMFIGSLVGSLVVAWSAPSLAREAATAPTGLDRYIAKADDSYSWKTISKKSADGMTTYVLEMASQTWRGPDEVDRPVWRHWLTVVVPDQTKTDIGLLWIGGGRNGGDPPKRSSDIVERVARAVGTVAAELRMVPNQPLVFHNDGVPRSEDDLIGYTWDQFLKTGDATWPARNPMVKSAVRAMDTMTALTAREQGGKHRVDKFVVAGGSKRGWTTWLTGAVDQRVVAIVPIVIDVLNIKPSMKHHHAAYGFWSPAVGDYVQHRIMERLDLPRMDELAKLVDPYHYRHRLTMPKYIVNAAGDQFFLPDSSRFYFDELSGEKYLRYIPNADHSQKGTDALESIAAFYWLIVHDKSRPRFSWQEDEDGSFRVTTVDAPAEVRLWQATNPAARDFRLESLGPKYTSRLLEDQGGGVYVAHVAKPAKGWTAFFVELTYDVGAPFPVKFTTNVHVTPDVLPHADEDPSRAATITLRCESPSEEVAQRIVDQVGALLKKHHLSANDAVARRRGTACRINWQPVGRFRKSAATLTEWLEQQGCSNFRYELHSGSED